MKNQIGDQIMPEQLTSVQAAEFLGCSVSFIRKQKQLGHLAFTQMGSRYTFEKQDLLKLIQKVEPHTNDQSLE